jgi:hypothetical protein
MHPRKEADLQEKRTARELGARQVPNSGALRGGGGADVEDHRLLVENKFTRKDFYPLHYADLLKLFHAAQKRDKQPVFQIDFISPTSTVRFAVLPRTRFDVTDEGWSFKSRILYEARRVFRLYPTPLVSTLCVAKRRVFIVFYPCGPHTTFSDRLYFEVLLWEDARRELQEVS